MSAVLQQTWSATESFEATLVRTRTMTRAEYDAARASAYRLEVESGLLRKSMPQAAVRDAARARQIRADISAPVDVAEARRERHWRRIYAALEYARIASQAQRTSRAVTRGLRNRRRDDVGPELRAVTLPRVTPPATPVSQRDEE